MDGEVGRVGHKMKEKPITISLKLYNERKCVGKMLHRSFCSRENYKGILIIKYVVYLTYNFYVSYRKLLK